VGGEGEREGRWRRREGERERGKRRGRRRMVEGRERGEGDERRSVREIGEIPEIHQ